MCSHSSRMELLSQIVTLSALKIHHFAQPLYQFTLPATFMFDSVSPYPPQHTSLVATITLGVKG